MYNKNNKIVKKDERVKKKREGRVQFIFNYHTHFH